MFFYTYKFMYIRNVLLRKLALCLQHSQMTFHVLSSARQHNLRLIIRNIPLQLGSQSGKGFQLSSPVNPKLKCVSK